MKPVKIYLQFPWRFSNCSYYKFLLKKLPKTIKYINNTKSDAYGKSRNYAIIHYLREYIKKIVRFVCPWMPNIRYTKAGNYNLIHCAHCISANKFPWICDTEFVGQFWIAGNYTKNPSKYFVRKYMNSKYCKRILSWSEWTKDGILKEFPKLKNKIEVLYPGIPYPKIKKKKKKKEVVLLYIAREFFTKGGGYALEIMDKMTKKYPNVKGVIISRVPKKIKNKYSKNKKIKIYELIPQEKLFNEIYPNADIFLYPSFTDTFGFALTEALSYGLPIVTVNGQSRKEIVDEEKTGFVIDFPKDFNWNNIKINNKKIIKNLEIKTCKLIENYELRKEMSKNCRKVIKDGRFSIKERNKKLKKIISKIVN